MTTESVNALVAEVAAMVVSDDQDLVEWLPLAARLAVLGHDAQLSRWSARVKELGARDRLEGLLVDRAGEGIADLEESSGVDLALAVVSAQDFHVFLEKEGEILPPKAKFALSAWVESSFTVELDSEACERLERWLELFPVPEEFRLPAVDTPLTVVQRRMLNELAPALENIEAYWPAPVEKRASAEREPILLDDASADVALRERWGRTMTCDLGGGESLEISRELNEAWEVTIEVDPEAVVNFVRMGLRAAKRDEEEASRWHLDLAALPAAVREEILEAPLTLVLRGSRRLSCQE